MKRRLWKGFKILLFSLAALVAVALVVVLAGGYWKIRRSHPTVEGTAAVPGLSAPVEVVRDEWGVPHLFAENERDLFFAQGYVHAQDRFWQMHFNRTVGSGRLSTLFGEAPLPADRYLRTLGLRRSAERDLETLSADTRAILEAYADGVNAFLESHRGRLPVEFTILGVDPEPWTPVDSLAWSRAMSLNLSLNAILEQTRLRIIGKLGEEAARQLIPPYPQDGPVIVPSPDLPTAALPAVPAGNTEMQAAFLQRLAPFVPALGRPDRVWGSNSWVVHGSRTATGKPILANDTHLGLAMPSVWYEVGLHGGRFDVVGFSLAGLPFVVIGQNPRAAWGVTNLNADVQDLYLEKLDNPENPTKALFQGKWEDLRVVREEIPVKGREEPEVLEVRFTRHGPLVHQALPDWKDPRPLALRWASAEGSRLLDAISALDRASSWQEFHQALSMWDTPSLNFVYADVDGNIAYQATARVPARAPAHDGLLPAVGWTGEHDWQGYIPYEEMPRALNPPAGFIVTANHKVVGDDYPHILTHDWPPPDRARRIQEVLAAKERVTMDDMKALQADTLLRRAGTMRPHLLAAADPGTDLERRALEAVRGWDLRFDADAVGATVYQAWVRALLPRIFEDEMGEELAKSAKPLVFMQSEMISALMERPRDPWFDDRGTPEVETRDDIVRRSFSEAVAWLADTMGDDPSGWRWGELHRISFAHQPLGMGPVAPLNWIFNSESLPVPGDGSTVNAMGGDPDQEFKVGFGPSQRYIADLSDLGRSLAVNSTGQAAFPFHPHRDDQVRMWARGEYHPVLAGRDAVRARSRSVLTLTPEK